MDRKAAKELLHIQGWFLRVDEIVQRGRETYLDDGIPSRGRRLSDDETRRGR